MTYNSAKSYIVETALLGQGLVSISSDQIKEVWPGDAKLAWVKGGEIVVDSIEAFLAYKDRIKCWCRLDGLTLFEGMRQEVDAFLTASATMAVALELDYPIVVTAGIGGIGDIKEERLCYDLPALAGMGITLVATSPKDMLDIPGTIDWLHKNGVKTFGINTEICDGYVFINQGSKLLNVLSYHGLIILARGNNLVLNQIPHEKRLKDKQLLEEAIKAGKLAEDDGQHYHPAANKRLDILSKGLSSRIQLDSLIANIKIARGIVEG